LFYVLAVAGAGDHRQHNHDSVAGLRDCTYIPERTTDNKTLTCRLPVCISDGGSACTDFVRDHHAAAAAAAKGRCASRRV